MLWHHKAQLYNQTLWRCDFFFLAIVLEANCQITLYLGTHIYITDGHVMKNSSFSYTSPRLQWWGHCYSA